MIQVRIIQSLHHLEFELQTQLYYRQRRIQEELAPKINDGRCTATQSREAEQEIERLQVEIARLELALKAFN